MLNFKPLALLVPLLASACAAGTVHERRFTASIPTAAFVTHDANFDSTAEAADDWWRLYRDPILDAIIVQALAANTDLRVASANLARSQAILQESRAGRLPSTTASGAAAYGDGIQGGARQGGGQGAVAGGSESQLSRNAGFAFSWELDLFGRIGRAIDAARADSEAIEAARDAVRVTVVAEATRAYLSACTSAYELSIARESLQTSVDTLRVVTAQEQAGSVNSLDVERAGVATANARSIIPAIEGQRQFALFELAALLGTTPDAVPQGARACVRATEPLATIPVGDGAALLKRRPDLRQAERQLAADIARVGVRTAELYPQISFGASSNFLRNETVTGSDSISFSLGPLLSWSFPNMTVARARLRGAEAQGDASLAFFEGRVLNALKEVEQALTTVAAGQSRVSALQAAVRGSERAFDIAKQRYTAGAISNLNLLASQSDLLTVRASHAAALRQLSVDRVDLFKALGGGWQNTPRPENGS